MKNILFNIILFCCFITTMFAQNKIKQYEYWLDNNYIGKQVVNITPVTNFELNAVLPNSGLTEGLHTFNIRFLDDSNRYSSVSTQLIEAFSSNPQIVSYEYWFDSSYSNRILVPVTPAITVSLNSTNINASSLSDGMHFFNIRFLDAASNWSSVQSSLIYKSGMNTALINVVSGYRYWIDNDFPNHVNKSISTPSANVNVIESIDLKGFPKGNHLLNIQFKDTSGLWSSVSSQNIDIKGDGGTSDQNLVCKYRYWLGNNFINVVEKPVIPQVAFANINDNIDFSSTSSGTKILNIQFKDTSGLWSLVVTDTIKVIHAIVANFNADKIGVCDSGNVIFTNNSSFFANSFKWDFGDTSTSNLINPTHYYNKPGAFAVKLIAIDTITEIRDSLVKTIFVVSKPVVKLGNDTTIKSGQALLLNAANPGCTYHWSTGDTTQTLTVNANGTYSVVVSNKGCTSSDTINVTVKVGIGEIKIKDNISIFPNPANTILAITLSLTSPETVSFMFFNPLGQSINQQLLKDANGNVKVQIDVSQLPAGIYFLSIKGQGWMRNEKIVKSE